MECVVWYFVGGDVRGYFVDNFSKVEDDVAYYNGADQKKKSFAYRMFFLSPSFWLYFNERIYEYGDKVKLVSIIYAVIRLKKCCVIGMIRWKKCN